MVVCVGVYGYVYGRVNQSRESNPGNQEIESSSIVESKTKYSGVKRNVVESKTKCSGE